MRTSSVSFVLSLTLLIWEPSWDRYVDPVFQHSRRHNVGFVRDLVKTGSVSVVDAVEHVGLFFVAMKAGAQMFIFDARVSCRISGSA